MDEKKTFYINLGSREISRFKTGNNDAFSIRATEEQMYELREILNEVFDSDERTFWRTHIPFKHYSEDNDNDEYDGYMRKAYQMIYELGDEDTKTFIHEIGMDEHVENGTIYGKEDPLS
ncbi:hypothetical protein [Pontibacillus litoralis]|uniref:Hydrolase n=1 Tax=Pontibacillus litoralis JSM 072002 TaxID=1385512 RepID=A0A0A5G6F1_9BACI|nr:hypothetical protein [Pontibacillus litoralis]KGX86753.1 hydrolase [Pontibacillus litoralis JSM 072002]